MCRVAPCTVTLLPWNLLVGLYRRLPVIWNIIFLITLRASETLCLDIFGLHPCFLDAVAKTKFSESVSSWKRSLFNGFIWNIRGTATLKGSSIGRSSCSKPSEHNCWIPAMASFESLATTFSPPSLPEPPRLASKTVILQPPLEQDVSCAVLFSSLHSCLFRAATVSRWYVCWSPKLTTGRKRIWDLAYTMQLLETMRSDLSVWTHVACMSWFGADLCSMALNGCSHVLEPWISHVVHISFAQRLSLSCGYSQAFCLWLVQHWDESHVFFFSAWLVPYLRCKWLPKPTYHSKFPIYWRGGR